jgi:hypothetical protein
VLRTKAKEISLLDSLAISAKIDLDALRTKTNEISQLNSLAIVKSADLNKTATQACLILDGINKIPQKIYVIQGLPVTKQKHFFKYSELHPIDGITLQTFSKPPVIITHAFDKDGNTIMMDVTATTDGIEAGQSDETIYLDLFIYPKK